jgi:DNA-directed RNA polymerase beta' subunit
MGAIGAAMCETCGCDAINCTGHFGMIKLNVPVIHPLYLKKIISFLRCVCIDCHRLIFKDAHVKLSGIDEIVHDGFQRFKKILAMVSKMDICSHCLTPQPTFKHNITDSTLQMVFLDKSTKKKIAVELSAQDILDIFQDLSSREVELLGFDPALVHPKNFILTALPVLPPAGRPFVRAAGNLCDDDLSNQYIEIIKANNKLDPAREDASPTKLQKAFQTLKFRIATTFNNSSGKARHTTNGRPVKCIKTRISGKDGQMRANVMGRRSDQTARTVIGPDATLKNDEMAIPRYIANILTIPEYVNAMNFEKMTRLVNSNGAVYVLRQRESSTLPRSRARINLSHALNRRGTPLVKNDIVVPRAAVATSTTLSIEKIQTLLDDNSAFRIGDGSTKSRERVSHGLADGDRLFRGTPPQEVQDVVFRGVRRFDLEIGDIVERKLVDGDILLLNRQPTSISRAARPSTPTSMATK